MAFSVDQIDHVEVVVRDIETAVRWYADVLGLREIRRWDPEPVMIAAGDTKLALFLADSDAPSHPEGNERSPRWRRVAWRTTAAGFVAAQEHLRECGVTFSGPIDHDVAESIYFRDPDDNPLEITWYLDASSIAFRP